MTAVSTFRCGHPRVPGNITGKGCALCMRVRTIRESVDRQLARWKRSDEPKTLGERIARGIVQ